MSFFNYVKAIYKAFKGEVEEVKVLEPTDADKEEAEAIVKLVCMVASTQGIPVSTGLQNIMKTTLSFGLRDLKEGVKAPEKLLFMRIIDEIKAVRNK